MTRSTVCEHTEKIGKEGTKKLHWRGRKKGNESREAQKTQLAARIVTHIIYTKWRADLVYVTLCVRIK